MNINYIEDFYKNLNNNKLFIFNERKNKIKQIMYNIIYQYLLNFKSIDRNILFYKIIYDYNKNINRTNIKEKFILIGSAHSVKEIEIKEKQGVKLIFLSFYMTIRRLD